MPPRSRAPVTPVAGEHPADRAVRSRDASLVPPEQRPAYQAVVSAFDAYAAGRDGEARDALAAVGLRSPFLDWRVLLRGLIARSEGDPARARENFARLDPARLPARLAAPFAAEPDPGDATPGKLAGPAKALFADPLVEGLLNFRRALGGGRGLGLAFRHLAAVVPVLKVRSPRAERELAGLMYHAVRRHGEPDDLPKLRALFGAYPDDPAFHRLRAMAHEESGSAQEVAKHWLAYEAWLSRDPAGWPPDLSTRARAMALTRAARVCAAAKDAQLAATPDPVPMWARAAELAPGWEPAALDLVKFHLGRGKLAEAEAAARAHLAHAPGALAVLEPLARILAKTGRAAEALAVRKRQLDAGPLDVQVRFQTARAHLAAARAALADDPRGALALAADGRKFREAPLEAAFLVLQAVSKRKLKDASADADLLAAGALAGARLEVAYTFAVNAGLAKLPPAAKTGANRQLADALAADPTAGEVAAALVAFDQYAGEGVDYRGSKAHLTKLLAAATLAVGRGGDEREFERLARASVLRNDPKLALKLLPKMRLAYPKNPLLALAEAEATIASKPLRLGGKLVRLLRIAADSNDDRHAASAARAKLLLDELFAVDLGDFPYG